MQKAALYTSGIFFAAAAVFHIVRLIIGIDIVIAGVMVPQWGSIPGTLIAALLAVWMLVAARH